MAFFELSSCRSIGFGAEGPIWWTAQNEMCKAYNIEGDQRDDFFFFIGQLDHEFQKYQEKTRPKDGKSKGKKGLTKRE